MRKCTDCGKKYKPSQSTLSYEKRMGRKSKNRKCKICDDLDTKKAMGEALTLVNKAFR